MRRMAWDTRFLSRRRFWLGVFGATVFAFSNLATAGVVPVAAASRPYSAAEHVIHWTQMSYEQAPGVPDPANGQVLTTDVWEVVGATGVPILMHSRSTRPDGSLHQEIAQTQQQRTVVYGQDYLRAGLFPQLSAASCAIQSISTTTDQSHMAELLPYTVDLGALANEGYAATYETLNLPLPPSTRVSGLTPSITEGSPTTVTQWSSQRAISNVLTEHRIIEPSANGRVVAERVWYIDTKGSVTYDRWSSAGTVDIYTLQAVPSVLLQVSTTERTECAAVTPQSLARLVSDTKPSALPQPNTLVGHAISPSIAWYFQCQSSYYMSFDGGACRTFYELGNFWWETQADTHASVSYRIQVEGNAYDSCNGGQTWTWRMSLNLTTKYNTNYVETPIAAGNYYDCQQNQDHAYYVWAYHAVAPTSSTNYSWDQNAYW